MKNFKHIFAIVSLIALCIGCTSAKASAPSDPAYGSYSIHQNDVIQIAPVAVVNVDIAVSNHCESFCITTVQSADIVCVIDQIEAPPVYSVRSPHTGYVNRCYYASALPDKISAGFSNQINAPPNKIG